MNSKDKFNEGQAKNGPLKWGQINFNSSLNIK